MKRFSLTIALAMILILALACSSSSEGSGGGGGDGADTGGAVTDTSANPDGATQGDAGGDTGEPVQPPWECTTDDDCDGGQVCDCSHACIEPGWLFCAGELCKDEASCSKWSECQPCERDANCGSAKYCDPCVHMCYEQRDLCDPCTPMQCDPVAGTCEESGNQCAEAGACIEYVDGGAYCARACMNDYGCPLNYKCREIPGFPQKQCIPETGSCENLTECETDADCQDQGYGFICNEALHICAPGCIEDESCPGDLICSGFHCTEACDPINNPCPEGFECDPEDGRCKKPGSCFDWRDCEEPETYCDPEDNMCKPGCLTDVDCKTASKVCENMACVRKACEAAWSCGFGQVCQVDEAAEDFGDCYEPEGPYCDECDGNDMDSCGTENLCVSFQDPDTGEDLGAFCLVACDLDDELNKCPQGYECAEIEVDGTMEYQCARQCPKPPITEW
jgi:hypothetical protein